MSQHYSQSDVHFVPIGPHEADDCHRDPDLAALARKIYCMRRDRESKSPVPGLFQDPAWDILLDLYMAHAEGKCISVKSAGLACPVPATTALRWLWALENAKLVERMPDKHDKRRSFVTLSTKGQQYMNDVLGPFSDQISAE